MSTVAAVVDRLYRDYLFAPDDQPVRVVLASAVDDAETTWSLTTSMLAADELDVLAPGVVLEAGSEQALILSDLTDGAVTVARAHNGTTATEHAAGTLVPVAPAFSRRSVFDAVSDNIAALYPSLYATFTTEVTSASPWVELPAGLLSVSSVRAVSGTSWWAGNVTLLTDFDDSATGVAGVFDTVGYRTLVTYRSRFVRPDDEADDLTTLGVRDEWERIVVVGAASQLLSGRDTETVTQNLISEQLSVEGFPPRTAGQIASRMEALRDKWLDEAQRQLRSEERRRVVHVSTRGRALR